MPTYRAQVITRFSAGTGVGTNTWHLRTNEPTGAEDDVSTLMNYVEAFYATLRPLFPGTTTWSWDGTVSEVGAQPEYQGNRTPWTLTGTNSSPGYGPAAGMACVTWRTSAATRSGRGRTFLGPLSYTSVQNSDGTLGSTALGTIRTAASELVASSDGNTFNGALGVYSRTEAIFRDFVGATVTDQVAVLRSRRS